MKRNMILITYGIILYIIFMHLDTVLELVGGWYRVGVPLVYGVVIAYMLNIPFMWFRGKAFGKLEQKNKRASINLSLVITYVCFFLLLALLIWFIIPQLVESVTQLVQNIPSYLHALEIFAYEVEELFGLEGYFDGQLTEMWLDLTERASELITEGIPLLANYILSLTSGLYNWIIGLIISVYFLSGKEVLLRQLRSLIIAFAKEKQAEQIMKLSYKSNFIFNRFITGNVIDSFIVGSICFIGLSIFNMPFGLLISLIIGVTNLIPIFGPFIGAVPGAFIIFIVDPVKALLFLVFILVLQQVDGNLIKPKVLGNTIGLPGIWVLISIVIGAGLFGVVGMLLGVPVFALIYSILKEEVALRLEKNSSEEESCT